MKLASKHRVLKVYVKREKARVRGKRYRDANPEKVRGWENTPKQKARRAAAKRRLRNDPAWRERERERSRRYGKTPQKKALRRFLTAKWRAAQAGAAGVDYCTNVKIQERFAYYGGRCAYCGAENATHIDHVIPLCRGGSAFPANLVPSCSPCNRSKSWRKPSEFGLAPSLMAGTQ